MSDEVPETDPDDPTPDDYDEMPDDEEEDEGVVPPDLNPNDQG